MKEGHGFQTPDYKVRHEARRKLAEPPCIFDDAERQLVEATIRRHCEIRQWRLLAMACRTNHVHVVVAAPVSPKVVMDQLKAWCTRRLKERRAAAGEQGIRQNWWTEDGSRRFLNDEVAVAAAVSYVAEGQ